MPNQRLIAEIGIEEFISQQQERVSFLQTVLEKYDDDRSKSFYCIAATLLSTANLKHALELADKGEPLKAILNRFAESEGQELKLRK